MARQLNWNKVALNKLEEILEYYDEEFSNTAARNLLDKIYKRLEVVGRFPESGRTSSKAPAVRLVTISGWLKIYYTFTEQEITVIYLFSNRRLADDNPYQ